MLFVYGAIVGSAVIYFAVRFFSSAYSVGEALLKKTEGDLELAYRHVAFYTKKVVSDAFSYPES
jgi:hypothetical protein